MKQKYCNSLDFSFKKSKKEKHRGTVQPVSSVHQAACTVIFTFMLYTSSVMLCLCKV